MERAIFWIIVVVLGLLAATFLSLWWAVSAAIPIVFIAWWAAYLSSWARRRMQVDDGSSASRAPAGTQPSARPLPGFQASTASVGRPDP